MKTTIAAAALSALCLSAPSISRADAITIDPTSDGSLYVCDGCLVVSDSDYVLVAGYIQGALKFSSAAILGTVSQALLSFNPYGLPLWDLSVEVYGYGTTVGQLEDADANAGSFLGTLMLPPDLGYGQDVFFDVTAFVRNLNAPFIAFNLRSDDTDIFSSLEFNYGHPSQLWVTTTADVSEPSQLALLGLALTVAFGISWRRAASSPGASGTVIH